jgi:outer membrane protein OmpA-like peptidoglycan-associated protein
MRRILALMSCATIAIGCSAAEPRQSDQTVMLTGTTDFPPDLGRGAPRAEWQETMVFVPVEAQRACEGMDPTFRLDSARVGAGDDRSLRVLSECLKNGALRNATLRLVGHADVRGSADYNDRLALQRAERVKLYLMKSGIPSERLIAESRGKEGAKVPPADWDRRVDFEVIAK